jgi:hypothetical protein
MKRPAVLVRFPRLRSPRHSHPLLAADVGARYPALAADVAVVERVVQPPFAEADGKALAHQNRHRQFQSALILGSALLSGFGGLQALFPEQRWPGVVLAVLGLVLASVGQLTAQLDPLKQFLDERIKAERLRSAAFRFLARVGRYSGADRADRLGHAVEQIQDGKEPA